MKGSPTWQLVATAPGNDRRSPCSASSRRPCGWRRQALLDVLADWVFTQIDPLANGFPTPMATHAFSAIDAHVYGFVPAVQYPHLSAMLHEQVLGHGYDFADEFDFGLELILDGLQRRLVWVHGERLSVTNEAMTAYPARPGRLRLGRGALGTQPVCAGGCEVIVTTSSPSARFAGLVDPLRVSGLEVLVHQPEPFVAAPDRLDLRRHAPYRHTVKAQALGGPRG